MWKGKEFHDMRILGPEQYQLKQYMVMILLVSSRSQKTSSSAVSSFIALGGVAKLFSHTKGKARKEKEKCTSTFKHKSNTSMNWIINPHPNEGKREEGCDVVMNDGRKIHKDL